MSYTQSILEYRLNGAGHCRLLLVPMAERFAMRMRTSPLCAFHGVGQGDRSHGREAGLWKSEAWQGADDCTSSRTSGNFTNSIESPPSRTGRGRVGQPYLGIMH